MHVLYEEDAKYTADCHEGFFYARSHQNSISFSYDFYYEHDDGICFSIKGNIDQKNHMKILFEEFIPYDAYQLGDEYLLRYEKEKRNFMYRIKEKVKQNTKNNRIRLLFLVKSVTCFDEKIL